MTASLVHVGLHSLWEMVSPAQVIYTVMYNIIMCIRFTIMMFCCQILLLLILVPDHCLSEPGDVNAVCEREGLLTDALTCTCQAPFTEGDGFNCSGTL